MPKEKKRAAGEPLKPPGKWGHEATVNFYVRHGGGVNNMAESIAPWFNGDPYAFAAKIADYVEKTTDWRADRCHPQPIEDYERTGRKTL